MMQQKKEWSEAMRWITPIGVTICIFLLTMILHKTDTIDDKLFKHLTNDEIHTPKSIVLTRPEFDLYQQMRQRQMEETKELVIDIRNMLRQHINDEKN